MDQRAKSRLQRELAQRRRVRYFAVSEGRQTNTLAVEVYRYSTGSYLEDQDMWRLSGIFRNVTLWSAPNVHVRDFAVTTDLDAQYRNATLNVAAKVHNYSDAATPARALRRHALRSKGNNVVGAPVKVAVPALAAGRRNRS